MAATDGFFLLHIKSKSSMPWTARACSPYTIHLVLSENCVWLMASSDSDLWGNQPVSLVHVVEQA